MVEINPSKSVLEIDREQLTPGMKQYQEAKKAHPDCLVMLRMGDFYEMFYEDAVTASRELEITLTARGKGEKRAPLAGIPYHALDNYLGRLIKKGYKVAIVEQLEDPRKAKGLVKRGLVRIITPGTVIDSSLLEEKENNYLLALSSFGTSLVLACCDLSTGEFFTFSVEDEAFLLNELARLGPKEIILPESLRVNQELVEKIKNTGCFLNFLEDYYFKAEKAREILLNHFQLKNLESFGLEEQKENIIVCGALLHYLISTQKNSLSHLQKISLHSNRQKMLLDSSTLRNLELLRNIKDGSSRGTLLNVLDQTITAMGSRLLKKWLKEPLLNQEIIEQRLMALSSLLKQTIAREEIRELLERVYDLERLISRVNYGNATPRDLLSLKYSLKQIPLIKSKLNVLESSLLAEIWSMPAAEEVIGLIELSIREEAPVTVREGGMIKPSFNPELGQLQDLKLNSKKYLQELEEREKEKTGISTLHLGFTQVFGYFLEVTKKNLSLVPPTYIRKQTTANSERYITEELKEIEEKILGAEERIVELEYDLFQEVLRKVAGFTLPIQESARKLAVLDVLCSLAKVAQENNYCLPEFVSQSVVQLKNSRHPVVEKMETSFITNDVMLGEGEMMLITGPNMSGKSTLMRQVALIVLMAQMGSYVPTERAVLGIVDRIFTRVGAFDDLTAGQSTFMVEMNETAAILNNATERSLIILDEIGRGTSTFDGVSIAWSVAEHLYNKIRARTLFSTHYHILNKLAERFFKVKNYNLAVREQKGEVIFLRKLIEGGTDQSYGVYVAKLAGMPREVVERAREIQEILQKDDEMMRKIQAKKLEEQKGLGEF